MKRHTFSVLFLIRKTRLLKTGEAPISMRITIDGRFVEMGTRLKILPTLWNQPKGRAQGKSPICIEVNRFLDTLRARADELYHECIATGIPLNPLYIKERIFAKSEACKMFFEVFQEHNDDCKKAIGITYDATTYGRYKTCLEYFRAMYSLKHQTSDLPMQDVDKKLLQDFDLYLRTERRLANNTVIRYMKCVRKIINMGLANGWIKVDPFYSLKYKEETVIRKPLSIEEIKRLMEHRFDIPRLDMVRDMFVFSCFTGLAFIDAKQLKSEHIVTDNTGQQWIVKPRQKTSVISNIPLLSIPAAIIEKYSNTPQCQHKGVLLPMCSNQKMNAYLAEIATICGIDKKLTTHIARHTFATVTQFLKIKTQNVSKMLGHTNLKMTQHYAAVLDESIISEMAGLQQTFEGYEQYYHAAI